MLNKKELRNTALTYVMHFGEQAKEWEHLRGMIDLEDMSEIRRASNDYNLAMAHLLTFIDELIDRPRFEYSPAIQRLVDKQNKKLYKGGLDYEKFKTNQSSSTINTEVFQRTPYGTGSCRRGWYH